MADFDIEQAEADKLMAVYDPIGAMAGVDDERMRALLDGVRTDSHDLQTLLDGLAPPESKPGLVDPDAVPDPPPEPITKPGDLITMGKHRLLCGDATNKDHVARLLGKRKPLLMVTDPPYGVNYDPEWRKKVGINKNEGRMGAVPNDDRADWTKAWALFPGRVAYVWHSDLHAAEVARSIEAVGMDIRCQIIWKKSRITLSRGAYHWQHEPCWYAVRKGGTAAWTGDRKQSTVWEVHLAGGDGDNLKGVGHGTQKPVECMERPLRNHGNQKDSVYDPFVGSGTMLIAAERQKRACFAMDIDPTYCDITVARWEEYTGEKAKRTKRRASK